MSGGSVNCTLFDEQGKCTAVVAVTKSMASFSLVGCVFMLAVIWLFSKYKLFVQRLILYLTIAALFTSIGYLMSAIKPEGPACSFEAFFLTFSEWSVLLWVLIITINLFFNAVLMKGTEEYEIIYSAIGWLLPLVLSCIPFIGDHYGPAGAWCWIQEGDDIWRFAIWYIPLFIIITVLFVLYLYITYRVSRPGSRWVGTYNPDNERQQQMLKEYVKPLKVYPLIFLVLSIFSLINRLQNAFSPSGKPVFALMLLSAATAPLQGFVNAVVYGLDPDTRSRLTWLQIKAALNKRNAHQPIREYPLVPAPETPDLEDVAFVKKKSRTVINEYKTDVPVATDVDPTPEFDGNPSTTDASNGRLEPSPDDRLQPVPDSDARSLEPAVIHHDGDGTESPHDGVKSRDDEEDAKLTTIDLGN